MAGDQLADAAHERSRRRLISTSWFLVCSSLRALNSARTSCAGNDFAVHRTEPAEPYQLGDAMRVLAIGLEPALPCRPRHRRCVARSPCRPAEHAARRFIEFFAATVRNKNTRMALPCRVPLLCLRRAAPDRRARRHRADPRSLQRLYRGAAGYGRQANRQAALSRDPHAVRLARREELADRRTQAGGLTRISMGSSGRASSRPCGCFLA
jgi:hypothetical protein